MTDNTQDSAAPKKIDPRRCTATSKKTGERCTAYAVKGLTECSAHAGLLDQKQASEKSAEVRRARVEERPKSVKDALAKVLERKASKIAEILEADIERQDSRAVMSWIEQVHGKPQQTVISEEASKPADQLTLAELERARASLLRDSNVTELRKPASQAG